MTQFFEVGEEDPALELVRFIERIKEAAEGDKFKSQQEEIAALVAKGQYEAVVTKLIADAPLLFTADVKEAELCFYLLNSIVRKLPAGKVAPAAAAVLAVALADAAALAPLRMKIASHLFNILEGDGEAQYGVLAALVPFAVKSGSAEALLPMARNAKELVEGMGVSAERQRAAFLVLYEALKDSHATDAHVLLLLHLATFESASDAELAACKPLAAAALAAAIADPAVYTFDKYLGGKAVSKLAGDAQFGALYDLATVFATGTLTQFKDFAKKNPKAFAAGATSMEECLRKMHLLSILGAAEAGPEVPYAGVAAALELPESDVELWVIRCVAAKLVDARIDQCRRVVVFHRVAQRGLQRAQWEVLATRLAAWRGSVQGMLSTVASARREHGGALDALTV